MRSRVEKKVMTRKTNPIQANKEIVHNQPCALSPPSENLLTKGSVSPCTTNWAMVAATKRMEVILVRSFISPDITPPKEAYGVLLKE